MDSNLNGTPTIRFAYLDNVRSLVILLVITMHTAVTYSGMGSWYYIEGSLEKLSIFEMVFFGFLQSFMQAWFMGILFFISAYLASKSLIKHGSYKFIKERLFRLGVPLLLYVFLISPFIMYIILGNHRENGFLKNIIKYITNFEWIGSTGPLWYVQILLVFCIIYTVFKKIFPKTIKIREITIKSIILIILIIAIIAFTIRLIFPVGTSFYNLQFSYFSSYVVMFILGIMVGENNVMEKIADEKNIKWIKLSLIIGAPLWVFIILAGGVLEGNRYFNGGFHWQSFAFALWESLTAIGFSLGLMAFFRKKVNIANNFTVLIKDNSFGIYFFHPPILITISLILKNWHFYPLLSGLAFETLQKRL